MTALPRAFGRLWTASTISTLGDGIYLAALPLLAVSLTTDPITLSLVTGAALLPWPLFGLVGGALADRWDRRRLMWITDSARAALLATAVLAGFLGLMSIPLLIGLAFLLGIGQVLFDTSAQGYIPQLLARDHDLLQRANTRLRGAQTAAEGFVGPPVGSLLFTLGRTVPIAVDAVSFVLSAFLIRSLPDIPMKAREARGSLLAEAREGASYLLRHRLLLGLALRPAVGNLAFTAAGAVMVLFARDHLHLDAVGYGLFLSAEAVGGLGGAFLAAPLRRWFGTGGALTFTAAVEAGAVLGMGLSDNAIVAGTAFAVCGCAMSATMVLGPSVRQAIVPEHLMGRVSAAGRLVAVSAGPVGAVFGGYLATVAGLRAPFLVGAGILASMTLITASLTGNRRIEAALAESRQTV